MEDAVKIGVTGGAGFIGSYVCEELKAQGHSTVILDHLKRSEPAMFADEIFLGDVRDETSVFEFAAHVEGIIHLAAVLGTQETIQTPIPSAETNIVGALNVFEACERYDLPCVYAGVGNHFMRLEGAGSYVISKTAAEDYARMYNAYRQGKITIVRPVNAYGPGQSISAPFGNSKVRKAMPSFICRALTGMSIEIYGDGTQISDFVYVEDVAKVFVRALELTYQYNKPLGVCEVGPGWREGSPTVRQVAQMVVNEVGLQTGNDPVEIKFLPMRPGEVPNAVVSAEVRTLEKLFIDPEKFVSLREGIGRTVEHFLLYWLRGYLERQANG